MGVRIAVLAMSGPGLRGAAALLAASGLGGVLDLSGASMDFPPPMVTLREDYGALLSELAGLLARP
jgi:hypothetical protein